MRGEPASERDHLCRVVDDQIAAVLLEPRRVGHDVPERDRLLIGVGDLEVEILVDVGVETQLALLHELHDGCPREQLAGRADAKEGALGIDGGAMRDIGVAVAVGVEELAVLDDGDGRAGNVLVAKVRGHDAIEERRELAAIADTARRRRYCGSRTEDLLLLLRRARDERPNRGWLGREWSGEEGDEEQRTEGGHHWMGGGRPMMPHRWGKFHRL